MTSQTHDHLAPIANPVKPGSPELASLLTQLSEGVAARELANETPHASITQIKTAGLGLLRIPVAEGGGGASVREFFQTLIDLAATDSNVAHILRVHFSFVEQQLQNPDAASRERWLSEVREGKTFGNAMSEQSKNAVGHKLDTILNPNGDGTWTLNGTKFYSTGSLYAEWTQVFANTPDGEVALATIPLDRAGVTTEDDWDGFGQRQTGTGTTRLDQVRVLADEVQIYGRVDEPFPRTITGAFLQLYLIAVTAGILKAVREDAVALVQRRVRSFNHSIADRPTEDAQILQIVGEISSDAFAAEAIVLAAADAIAVATDSVKDGLPDPDLAHRAQLASAQAKSSIDRFSFKTATALFDVGGASATQRKYNLDRHWRNARTIAGHNPTFGKSTAVGDFEVNGASLPTNGFF